MSEKPRNVNFRWSDEFVARIDAVRGLIPRSAYVRAAIESTLAVDEALGIHEARVAPFRPKDGAK
jgi:hypothetical protein